MTKVINPVVIMDNTWLNVNCPAARLSNIAAFVIVLSTKSAKVDMADTLYNGWAVELVIEWVVEL